MNTLELTDEEKFLILEQKRILRNERTKQAYYKRKEEGRNFQIIPKEQHKPRGRKCKLKTLAELEASSIKINSVIGRPPRKIAPVVLSNTIEV